MNNNLLNELVASGEGEVYRLNCPRWDTEAGTWVKVSLSELEALGYRYLHPEVLSPLRADQEPEPQDFLLLRNTESTRTESGTADYNSLLVITDGLGTKEQTGVYKVLTDTTKQFAVRLDCETKEVLSFLAEKV